MATPFVSATAALMMSAIPSPNPEVVVSLIKASVTKMASLSGKVTTGGMLDAGEALRQLTALPQPERLAGPDRYATAAAVAASHEPGVPIAYVATGLSFPDALAGAALAGAQHAPLLLTTRTTVPSVTAQALTRLQPADIVVLGGPASVSDGTMQALATYATSGSVSRLAGADRYLTAAAVGAHSPAVLAQTADGQPIDAVYIASGVTFPDALAGAPRAGADGQPVLLTARDTLPSATARALADWKPKRIFLLGGPASVSSSVATQLQSYAPVTRLAGADRFATAAAIAKTFGTDVPAVYMSNGEAFPDALAGAALAGSQQVPVLLTNRATTPRPTTDALTALSPGKVVILGGDVSVGWAAALGLGTYAAP